MKSTLTCSQMCPTESNHFNDKAMRLSGFMNQEALKFNLQFSSVYVQRLWLTRLRLPITVMNTKFKAWRLKSTIQGVLFRNRYEIQELGFVYATVRLDDTVLELGTGMGFLTNEIAQVASKGWVHTFEANPTMYSIAEETFRLNRTRNIKMHSGVVGNTSGTTSFYMNEDFEKSSLLGGGSTTAIEVEMTRIDDILDAVRPNMVVMDIEGGEYELLKNHHFLSSQSIRDFIIEFHPVENLDKCLRELGPFFDVFRPSISLEHLAEQLNHGPCSMSATRRPA